MSILLSKTLWGAVGALLLVALVFNWGDRYGPNAQRYAAYAAEEAAKNAVLTKQLEDDATIYAAEHKDLGDRVATFKADLQSRTDCPLDAADLNAFDKLIGG